MSYLWSDEQISAYLGVDRATVRHRLATWGIEPACVADGEDLYDSERIIAAHSRECAEQTNQRTGAGGSSDGLVDASQRGDA